MKIGFIGLGKMGGAIARNLIRKQYDVTVYDISTSAMHNTLKVGGKGANSPTELALEVDLLFTSLPLPKHLLDLLINDSSLLSIMKKGTTVVDLSSNDPNTALIVQREAEKYNIDFLACPLGKGPKQAEEGTEPIFAGGKKEVYLKFEELLNQIGSPVYYLGGVEQSTAFKLISNMVGMSNLLVMCEGLKLGIKAGIDPHLLVDLLGKTGADSYQLQLRAPWILNNDFNPRFTSALALKDLKLGVGMAENMKQKTYFSSMAQKLFEEAVHKGWGDEDCSAVYKIYGE